MSFRHVLTCRTENKEVNKKLDDLDKYFYEVLEMVPATSVLTDNEEDAQKQAKFYKLGKNIVNEFIGFDVYELQRIEELDTKMDGLSEQLDRIETKLEIMMRNMNNIPESTKREHNKK